MENNRVMIGSDLTYETGIMIKEEFTNFKESELESLMEMSVLNAHKSWPRARVRIYSTGVWADHWHHGMMGGGKEIGGLGRDVWRPRTSQP